MYRTIVRSGTVALGLAIWGSAAQAQEIPRLVITPYAGVYVPTTNLGAVAAHGQAVGARASLGQQAGLALGANASVWITPRVAVEAGLVYAMSDLKSSMAVALPGSPSSIVPEADAWVAFGSLKLMMQLLPVWSPTNLRFGVGPAIIRRGGAAYTGDEPGHLAGTANYGAAASLCTRLPVTERVGIRLRAETFVYRARLRFEDPDEPGRNFAFPSRVQTDFVLSGGLQVRW
jgi:hypothetical protein